MIFFCMVNVKTMDTHRISNMTRQQYTVQVKSAKKELRRQKQEVKMLKKQLDKAILDHQIAVGYENTVNTMQSMQC